MLPIHTEPDEKNQRADFVIGLSRTIRARIECGMEEDQIHAQLVGENRATEEEYFLALAAAKTLTA